MKRFKFIIILGLFSSLSSFASPPQSPVNALLRCSDGTHIVLKDGRLQAEGIIDIPFERIEEQDNDHILMVYGDNKVEAKILMRFQGNQANVFVQNNDGSLTSCIANQIP